MRTGRAIIFVRKPNGERADGDTPLPIGNGQTISQNYIVAFMTKELDIEQVTRA